MTNLIYAGIGSRETPETIRLAMGKRAFDLALEGWTLRSGAANGADSAFEAGWMICSGPGKAEIWLPWRGYRQHHSLLTPTPEAFELTALFHPAWHKCSKVAKAMHARNAHIILGADLKTPVEYVLYWTKDGLDSGGTGQGLRIARHYQIPCHLVTDS